MRLGRRLQVCRGCLATAVGGGLGLVGGALAPAWPAWLAPATLAVGAAAWLVTTASGAVRLPKAVSRALPAGALLAVGSQAVRGAQPGTALAAGAVLAAGALLFRRRGPARTPCGGCPQRRDAVCAGMRPIVRRERALQRIGRRLLAAPSGD